MSSELLGGMSHESQPEIEEDGHHELMSTLVAIQFDL